ncbi:bis(5'-nucleosyl)-tetraphosphatase (symmetrical) YqeK [Oceanivirga miroungae]|uniref:bis(5'-nucleosyl)-tetraphosphatase (symmetrical) n=1 Tax=Oceanivirga miroungae TaxID=1130046 RepID=A0A6I8M565_9FUSO|nr:bis(5'-nucleosyl)-tetraphosphatase (symmetrical) YqeK [Oceanivirga miroungae]VWL85068.1 metal dependent phosphohydrolase [Oceanivirga miroungae]
MGINMDMKDMLSEKRYNHCLRTKEMAEKLCDRYNIDKKAIDAAFYHDICKELSLSDMIELIGDKYANDIDGMYNKSILHGYAGAKFLETKLGILDEEILSAVRYHTTGKKNMTDIEKVVYISDAIELGRDYPNVDKIREKVFENLNEGILMEIDYKIKMLIDKKVAIHKNTIEFRNELIKEVYGEK